MSRKTARKAWLSTVGLGVGIWGSSAGRSAEPGPLAPKPPFAVLQPLDKKDKKDVQPVPKAPETTPIAPVNPFADQPIVPPIQQSPDRGPAPISQRSGPIAACRSTRRSRSHVRSRKHSRPRTSRGSFIVI